MSSLALTPSGDEIVEGDFIFIHAPCVREDRIRVNLVDQVLGQPELTTCVEIQRAHRSCG